MDQNLSKAVEYVWRLKNIMSLSRAVEEAAEQYGRDPLDIMAAWVADRDAFVNEGGY